MRKINNSLKALIFVPEIKVKNYVSTFLLSLVIFSGNVFAEKIQSEMLCKLTEQKILTAKDGRGKSFSGYEEGLDIGDTMTLRYLLDLNKNSLEINMASGDLNDLKNIIQGEIIAFADTKKEDIFAVESLGLVSFNKNLNLNFGKNRLRTSKGSFARYYKDDWHGITQGIDIHTSGTVSSHTYVWNCQHKTPSKFDEIYDILIKRAKS